MLVLASLIGCPESSSRPSTPPPDPQPREPQPSPPRPPASPAFEPIPTGGEARRIRIEVVNATDEAQSLDVTYGLESSFGVAAIGRRFGPVGLDRDATPNAIACDCPCNDGARCPECERPREESVTIARGAVHVFEWNGRLRHRRMDADGDNCFDAFAAPAGRYILRACAGPTCGRAEVTLPADVIRIELGTEVSRDACPLSADLVERAALAALHHFALHGDAREQIRSCAPGAARCVARNELDAAQSAARGDPCTIFVVPDGRGIAAEIFAPLPPTFRGGERYVHDLDPDATSIRSVRYEQ